MTPAPSAFAGMYVMANLEVEPFFADSSLYRIKSNGEGSVSYAMLFTSSGGLESGRVSYGFDPATGLLAVDGETRGVMTDDGQAFLLLSSDDPVSATLSFGLKTSR